MTPNFQRRLWAEGIPVWSSGFSRLTVNSVRSPSHARVNLFGIGESSSSTAIDQKAAASEAAISQGQAFQSPVAKDQAIQAGTLSKILLPGAVEVGPGGTIRLGQDIKGNRDVTITTADPDLLKQAFAELAELSDKFQGTVSALVKDANAAAAAQDAAVLGKLSELAESKQTEGQSGSNKTVLYVVLAIVAGVVIWALND